MRRAWASRLVRPPIIACLLTAVTAVAAAQKPVKRVPVAPAAPGGPPSTAAVPAAVERAVPFRANEALKFDVSWSNYLTAGVATLTVREKRPSFGSTAYYIVAEGRPTGLVAALYSVYYKADTLLDVYTLLPQRGSLFSQEGKRRKMKVTRFDHPAHAAEYQVQTASLVKRSVAVPNAAQDALSAIYVLRTIVAGENDRFSMPVCDGGANYRVLFEVGRRETVKSGIGSLAAFPITSTLFDAQRKAVGRPMRLWLSDDARRLPLKLQADLAIGSVQLTLVEAK